jgi:adenosylmethionine-8-amino-7-oxononanoate aminotransferase
LRPCRISSSAQPPAPGKVFSGFTLMSVTTQTRKHLATGENQFDLEITGSDTFYLLVKGGKRYLDFISGWCVGNLGWGNREIRSAIRGFKGPAYVYPSFNYAPWAELSSALCRLAGGGLQRCFRATGGTEAVDLALQIASVHTGRRKFLSLEDCYHGNSLAALSIGASSNKEDVPALLQGCNRISGELTENRLEHIKTLLSKKDIAAFILEPVQMNLGVRIPSPEFMKGLQKLCRQYGTVLIADEVASGFGRTGKLFATEHFDLQPDIMTLGKAMSGGYASIGATLTTDTIYRKVKDKVQAYSTYGWHPLSVAAALACLRHMEDQRKRLMDNVEQRSQQLRTALSQTSFKKGGRLSILGLAVAVDVEDKKYAALIQEKCRRNGLLITSIEERIVMFPALTVTKKVVDEAITIIEKAV